MQTYKTKTLSIAFYLFNCFQVQYNPNQGAGGQRRSGLPVPSSIRNAPPPPIPEEIRPTGSNTSSPASTHSASADKEK